MGGAVTDPRPISPFTSTGDAAYDALVHDCWRELDEIRAAMEVLLKRLDRGLISATEHSLATHPLMQRRERVQARLNDLVGTNKRGGPYR